MPHKLIYTSAPRLLQAGRSGFGTVAMSRDIPPQAVKTAEDSSIFSRQPGLRLDRVIYAYRTVRCADGFWHVLTSVQDAGADYSGRTNHLAQHLILSSSEASNLANSGHTPAGVMLGTVCSWGAHDGFCGWLEGSPHAVSSEPDDSWKFWNAYTGSGYCRLNLCSDAALRGAVLVYGKGLDQQTADEAQQVLCLFAESQAGCPDRGWGTSFTTSLEPNDEISDFRWIGVAEDSPMLAKLEAAGGRVKITFDTPPPAARQPSSTAASASLSFPTASSDALGNLHKDLGSEIDASASVGAGQPPRIPPKRPLPAHKKESFLKRHRAKLEGVAIALVVLATAGFFLRSLLSEKAFAFRGPLSFQYDEKSKSAVLADEGSVVYLYAEGGTDNWSSQPPIDAGRYPIGVETSSWFGLVKRIVPTGRTLEIAQRRPTISFPQQLDFVTTNGSTKTWPIEPTIDPPAAAAGKTVEYRWLRPRQGDWEEQARVLPGEYEVRVSTRETRNFAAATEVTNFTISAPEFPDSKTNSLADLASSFPATAPTELTVASAATAPLRQDISSTYYLASGPDALRLANESDAWRANPTELEVRQWGDDLPNYRSIKDGRLSKMSDDFAMTPGGLPAARKSTSEIKRDELVFRASYSTDPRQVFVIGLKRDGSSDGAVRDLLPGKAWLRRNKTSSLLEVASANEFFKHAKLLPSGSKWILVYEDQPYSEGGGSLQLESDTAVFDVKSHIEAAERDKKTAAAKLTSFTEQAATNPPAGDNYFDQNKPAILQPLEQLSSSLAKSLAEQIRSIPKPNVDGEDSSSRSTLASALLIGALKVAYNNQEIQARMQLSLANKNKIEDQLRRARSHQGGRDYKKISDENLLPLDELESWLTGRSDKPPSTNDVESAAVNWLNWRVANLQEPPKGALNDPVKEVLLKLRQGIESCGGKSTNETQKIDPALTKDSLARQIQAAEAKVRVLSSWGTPGASGRARLEVRLGQSEPITLLPGVFLGPDMEAVK